MKFKDTKFDITGRVALITGGAGLLGIKHASALLEIGATVFLTDINLLELEKTKKILVNDGYEEDKIHIHNMDVSDEQSILSTLEFIHKKNMNVNLKKSKPIYIDLKDGLVYDVKSIKSNNPIVIGKVYENKIVRI